jgi:muconolactone delta-isomerase
MLFFIKLTVHQPSNMTQKDVYNVWLKEAEVAIGAKQSGVIKGLYKVSGLRQVLVILDVQSHRDLDRILSRAPLVKEIGHGVELEILPIYPYEEFAEDMKKAV